MASLLIKIIPLDLAATLSPGILALSIILLSGRNKPKEKTFSLLLGTLVIAITIAIAGFFLGQAATPKVGPTLASAIIDCILGIVFILWGFKLLSSKERKIKNQEGGGPEFFKWFTIGIVVSATNFDAVLLSFAAAKEVGNSALGILSLIILLIVNIFFFVLPTSLPMAIDLLFPKFTGLLLEKINRVVLKYSRYILFAMFLIFGIYFLSKSLDFFG